MNSLKKNKCKTRGLAKTRGAEIESTQKCTVTKLAGPKMKIDQKNVHYTLKSYIEKNRLLLKNVHNNQIKEEDSEPIIGSESSFIYCLTPLPFSICRDVHYL